MTHDECKTMTAARMADPRPGDTFDEMCSFWVKVVDRDGAYVVSQERRCVDWAPPRLDHLDEFRRRFAYSHNSGYWVLASVSRGSTDVVPAEPAERCRWLARLHDERTERLAMTSMASACL